MRTTLSRVVAGAAALAVASVALLASSAAALPPGTPAAGAATVTPLTGNSSNVITLAPPSGAVCPGDTATNGYKWQTFLVAASVDPATLTYNGSGPVSGGSAFTQPMLSAAGTPVVAQNTAVTTGLITGIPTMSFGFFPAGFVPAGAYNIGFACSLAGATERFWSAPLTITTNAAGGPAQINFAYGALAAAPVLGGTLTAGDQTLAGTFTHAASIPATTAYTVTAVPTSGTTVTLPLAAGSTSFTLTGLVNGTQYAVSVTATNTVGVGPASNTVNGTPNPGARPAVTNLAAVPGTGIVDLSWTTPTGVAPTGYSIAVSPSVAGSPFTAAAGATSFQVTGLVAGTSYTFTVTPNHPSPYVGTAASVSVTPNAAQVIIQDITVVRPAGALVLTQRCGVYGALPAEPASPGFASLLALVASVDQVGTAPTLTVGGAGDPNFPTYPSPSSPNYPTHCGLDMGSSQLVTSGSLSGQYYAASGRLNQVTVSDTRDTDTGWTVNGTMSAFTSPSLASFSGNYLGWSPVVTSDSAATSAGYDQTAVAGASVLPNTAAGLATPKVLSSAAAGAGLGIASFDARLKLLIPVSAPSGTYKGTLTFTVI